MVRRSINSVNFHFVLNLQESSNSLSSGNFFLIFFARYKKDFFCLERKAFYKQQLFCIGMYKIFADSLCNMKRKHPSLTFIGDTTFLGLNFLINVKIGGAFEKNF